MASSLTPNKNQKRWTQLRLNEFFGAAKDGQIVAPIRKINKRQGRIRRFVPSSSSSDSDLESEYTSASSSRLLVRKRKLVAPFSDDETGENIGGPSQKSNRGILGFSTSSITFRSSFLAIQNESPKKPMTNISLNKTVLNMSPQKVTQRWMPRITSTPSTSSEELDDSSLQMGAMLNASSPNQSSLVESSSTIINISVGYNSTTFCISNSPIKARNHTKASPRNMSKTSPLLKSPTKFSEDKKGGLNLTVMNTFQKFFSKVFKSKLKFLLKSSEQSILINFFEMETNYQYTGLKLFMYLPHWYNIFNYMKKIDFQLDDSDVIKLYRHFEAQGFVKTDYSSEDVGILLNNLDLKSLRDIYKSFKLSGTKNKSDIISSLLKHCNTQSTLTYCKSTGQILKDRIKKKMGYCVKISDELFKSLFKLYLLNTFANSKLRRPQDYFAYFHQNIAFPNYRIESYVIFLTSNDFDR